MTKKKVQSFFNSYLYILVFFASFYTQIDPDLGWELKYGEYLIKYHQILRTNILSTILPNFYWVNHSWGADAILYSIYARLGFFGLSIAGAFVITLIYYFYSKAAKLTLPQKLLLFPFLFYLEFDMNSGALRTQLISLFLQSILIFILYQYERGRKKILYVTIPLFLLWANLHGEFILGLCIFLLWLIFRICYKIFFTNRKETFRHYFNELFPFLIFAVSALCVLINPFGIAIYTESFAHFFNPNLQNVIEWQPLGFFTLDWWNLIMVGVILLWGIWILRDEIKNNVTFAIITILFFILSLFSRRYVWPFYYLTLPFFAMLLNEFFPKLEKISNKIIFIILCLFTIVVIIIKYPYTQYTQASWNTYCNIRMCSTNAAEYLITHHLNINQSLYSDYDLGGWLIWNYPQNKTIH